MGVYLLFDDEGRYLTATSASLPGEDGEPPADESGADEAAEWELARQERLRSAESLRIDGYRSEGEWELEGSAVDPLRYQIRHGASGLLVGLDALVEDPRDAAVISLVPAEECASFPELSVDATGEVVPRTWDDGDLFGIVDAHSHLLTNKGFGGGMFHGAPYHRLGVTHALSDCDHAHGEEGRRDLIGYFLEGDVELDTSTLLPIIGDARTPEFNHLTDGYPTFSEWPNAWGSITHQVQYYRWLERAWKGGLRLVVELGTGNSVLCDFLTGIGAQQTLYECSDMVGVDRALVAVREMERYIDAQHGGPGEGWFRVVESPAEAREVVRAGKLAVVLGIETSNLFDCYLSPPPGVEPCTSEDLVEALDRYHALGVRVIFPVHKYDNAFSAGDGQRGIIELGNMVNSSHYSNLVDSCPLDRHTFDNGNVTFGGLNRPRDDYFLPPPLNLFGFARNPVAALLPLLPSLQEPGLEGNYCQNAGLTPLGEFLIEEIMARGMVIDIAHLPQRSTVRALEILEAAEYPATSTHGDTYGGRLFELGGMGSIGFRGCASLDQPDTLGDRLRDRVRERSEHGLYPAEGFAFDFNGFAGSRRPRFGELSPCPQPQPNPITYPFASFDGTIEFTAPQLGDRAVDFNTEGMIHIGLLPELIEEVRRDGMSDEDLEPLFRSAESWVRLWEAAEARPARVLTRRGAGTGTSVSTKIRLPRGRPIRYHPGVEGAARPSRLLPRSRAPAGPVRSTPPVSP